MDGVRDGETFEGIGDPAEEKTLLEPPTEATLEGDDLETDEALPIDDPLSIESGLLSEG